MRNARGARSLNCEAPEAPVSLVAGQRELGAHNPARGGGGPSATNGPSGPLCDSDSAMVGGSLATLQAQEAPRFARCPLRVECSRGIPDFRRFGAAERA
eukprot:15468149-Alexandrium_andersonii.AAC.1